MSNSKEEKVFRKEVKKPSKGEENFFTFCIAVFFYSLIGLAITFTIIIIRDYPLQYELTTFTSKLFHFYCMLTPISLFLLYVGACVCTPISYTLILDENTLTYKSNDNTTTLSLPCSSKKEKHLLTLANDNIQISLSYDETEDAELLEFLKDVIN